MFCPLCVRVTLLLAGALALALVSAATPGDPPPARAQVQQLVDQLGERNYQKRTQAIKQLEAIGTPALPALRPALQHPDPEVRRGAVAVVTAIENASFFAPTLVTLKVRQKTLKEIVAAFQEQTGTTLLLEDSNDRRVYDLSLENVPFWRALDEISRVSGLSLTPRGPTTLALLDDEEWRVGPTAYDRCFRIVPTGAQMNRVLRFTPRGPQREQNLLLQLHLFSEPRVPLLSVGQVQLESALDSEGKSMLTEDRRKEEDDIVLPDADGQATIVREFELPLTRGGDRTSLRRLTGTIPVVLLTERKTVTVLEPVAGVKDRKVKLGTTTFHVDRCKQNGGEWLLDLRVTEESGSIRDYNWAHSLLQRLRLIDQSGKAMPLEDCAWGEGNARNVKLTLRYETNSAGQEGAPGKLVYEAWKTRPAQARFEFRDLPLP